MLVQLRWRWVRNIEQYACRLAQGPTDGYNAVTLLLEKVSHNHMMIIVSAGLWLALRFRTTVKTNHVTQEMVRGDKVHVYFETWTTMQTMKLEHHG